MDDIVESVQQVSAIISEISLASREQLSGIEQINRAIANMDTATQQNAAMVEQSTAAATNMAEQARELASAVARFTLAPSGRSPAQKTQQPASLPTAPRANAVAVNPPVGAAFTNAAATPAYSVHDH